jgi:hypothetical protein
MAITIFDLICAYFDVDAEIAAENVRRNLAKFQEEMLEGIAQTRAIMEAEDNYIREGYQILKISSGEQDILEETMTFSELWDRVEAVKQLGEIIKSGHVWPIDVARLTMPFVMPPAKRGRKSEPHYDWAFPFYIAERIRLGSDEGGLKSAFEKMVKEWEIPIIDASDALSKREAFKSAMKKRSRDISP